MYMRKNLEIEAAELLSRDSGKTVSRDLFFLLWIRQIGKRRLDTPPWIASMFEILFSAVKARLNDACKWESH